MLQLLPHDKVKEFFPYHRQELVKTFLLLSQCILQSRTLCLYKCRAYAGGALGNKVLKKEIVYKKFIRFFSIKCPDAFCIGIIYLIINILGIENSNYLIIDRTNWKIGKTNVNILYLGFLLPNGSFIPILFETLDKRGNSNFSERSRLLQRFCELLEQKKSAFSAAQKSVLLADREFIGVEWFKIIVESGFSLVIRLRNKSYLNELCAQQKNKKSRMLKIISKSIENNGYFRASIILGEQPLYYIALPLKSQRKGDKKDEYLILITDDFDVNLASQRYALRWKIEVFFFNVKSNGFNLEDINLKEPQKMQLMLTILGFLYVLIHKEHLVNRKVIKEKTFKKRTANAISIFRNSYDDFKIKVLNINDLINFIIQNLNITIKINQDKYQNVKYLNLKSG
ncbi:MAG: hypothetical protein RL757_512 [Bacteroidota bacterium]|jgi:hypothetical protein